MNNDRVRAIGQRHILYEAYRSPVSVGDLGSIFEGTKKIASAPNAGPRNNGYIRVG